jgi:hypothetical protein
MNNRNQKLPGARMIPSKLIPTIVSGFLMFAAFQAQAGYSFEGYLSDSSGNPMTSPVPVELKVVSPGAEACVLYKEVHASVTPDSEGYVALEIGSGSRTDGLGHTLERAFGNYGTMSSLTDCSSGSTYTPLAGAKRLLFVTVNGVSLGSMDLSSVPNSTNAEKVGAHSVASLLRVETGGIPANATALTVAEWTGLQQLIAGTSSAYMKANAAVAGASLPSLAGNPSTPVAGSIWYDNTSGTIKFKDGAAIQSLSISGASGGGVTSINAIAPLVSSGTTAITISLGNSGVGGGTYQKVTVNAQGLVTAGMSLSAADVSAAMGYTAFSKSGDTMTGIFGHYGTASDPATGGWGATEKGHTWFNTSSNQIKYWDGSSIQVLGTAGAGLTSLNGETGGSQTFSYSIYNSIPSPQIISSGNIHYLKYPMANAVGVTAGLLSKTEFDNFTAKLDGASPLTGDVTGTIGATSLSNIQGHPLTAGSPSSGQVLRYSGSQWQNSPIDANDIQSGVLVVGRGGTGVSSFPPDRVIVSNATGAALVPFTCAMYQVMSFNGAGIPICTDGVLVGGNPASGPLGIGTNNGNDVRLLTNAVPRLTISPSGFVGIGTTTPSAEFEVAGQIKVTGGAPGVGKVLTSDAGGLATWMNIPIIGNTSGTTTNIGQSANGSGTNHVGVGSNAGYNNTGSNNTFVGNSAAGVGGTGSDNTIIGNNSGGGSALTGSYNTLIGSFAAVTSSVNYAVAIGKGANVTGTGGVAIGPGASAPANSIVMGTSNGSFQERLRIDSSGNVGIGTPTPAVALDVMGQFKVGPAPSAPISGFYRMQNINWSGGAVSPTTVGTMVYGLTGVAVGDSVICNPRGLLPNGAVLYCYVSSPGQVTIAINNTTGTTMSGLGSTYFDITAIK